MKIIIEKQSDGTFIAYNNEGEGTAIGVGETVSEAKNDFFNSLEEIKECAKNLNQAVPEITMEKIEFRFDISSLFEYFSIINVSDFARLIGINPTLMRQYKSGKTYISDQQLEKIQKGIHKLGHEFMKTSLV